jgi:hypothetical protein
MSYFDRPPPGPDNVPPLPSPPPPRDGCQTALLILAGVVLLFPGLCTWAIFGWDLFKPSNAHDPLVQIFFIAGFVGIVLIVVAVGLWIYRRRMVAKRR